jgi:hypothetical protein
MKTWTERFAHQLVKDNAHLASFLVELSGFAEVQDVATVLRSEGHRVAIHRTKNRITIMRRYVASV